MECAHAAFLDPDRDIMHTQPCLQWFSLGDGGGLISLSLFPMFCTFQTAITF